MPDSQQRYRVIEKIDAGGMAEVFRAEREGLEGFAKQVAIKRVLPHLSEKERFIRLFLDEARLSARLNHSNCVQVFDIGYGENSYFIVMEWVDGTGLKALVEHYRGERFVQVMPLDAESNTDGGFFDALAANDTNRNDVFVFGNDERVLVVSRLDNLGKGASGAAVQCMNLMLGFDEGAALA